MILQVGLGSSAKRTPPYDLVPTGWLVTDQPDFLGFAVQEQCKRAMSGLGSNFICSQFMGLELDNRRSLLAIRENCNFEGMLSTIASTPVLLNSCSLSDWNSLNNLLQSLTDSNSCWRLTSGIPTSTTWECNGKISLVLFFACLFPNNVLDSFSIGLRWTVLFQI